MARAREVDVFEIDKYDLDNEWVNQPLLYRKYARRLAKQGKRLEQKSAALKVAKAEACKAIRKNPTKYGYARATDKVVESGFPLHPLYKKAIKEWIAAKFKYDLLFALVRTLDQRKSALERLVHLHGQDYFSRPTAMKGDHEQVEKAMQSMARNKKRRKKGKKK